jgi:hypothetical protein
MGAVSVSILGEGCEKVHDIFDELIVDDEISGVLSNEVMTTWHSREPLSEAVFYLLFCSVTFERHKRECLKSIAISIGDKSWAEQFRLAFRNPKEFADDS